MNPKIVRDSLAKVKELIENSPIPDYIHVALLHVREEMPELAEPFSDLPDSAVIVLHKGHPPAVLLDEDGNALCFRNFQ